MAIDEDSHPASFVCTAELPVEVLSGSVTLWHTTITVTTIAVIVDRPEVTVYVTVNTAPEVLVVGESGKPRETGTFPTLQAALTHLSHPPEEEGRTTTIEV